MNPLKETVLGLSIDIDSVCFTTFCWVTHTRKYYGDAIAYAFWLPATNDFITKRIDPDM
jgi:hypothetical protein